MRRNGRILWIFFLVVVLIFCGSYVHQQPVTGSVIISSNSSADAEKPNETGAASCCWLLCIVVGLASGSAGVFTLTIVVCIFWRCNRQNTIMSFILSTKTKKTELQKQSQKTQEELDACVADLTPLMELKSGLLSQREEFRLELEETEEEMEENREKVRLVERKISESEREKATDKTEGYLREKQNLINVQRKLEKRKEEVEKQQLNMEKLVQKTERIMETVTERKRRVENHMVILNMQLEELESQKGE